MGLIAMSERDLQRIEVLSKVIAGRMSMVSAAHVLALSERQVRRLLERIRTDGDRPTIEQPDQRRRSGLCGDAGSRTLCGLRSDAGSREACRARWIACVARDAATLVAGGYALEGVTPVDQFRYSAHVELVGVFRRGRKG